VRGDRGLSSVAYSGGVGKHRDVGAFLLPSPRHSGRELHVHSPYMRLRQFLSELDLVPTHRNLEDYSLHCTPHDSLYISASSRSSCQKRRREGDEKPAVESGEGEGRKLEPYLFFLTLPPVVLVGRRGGSGRLSGSSVRGFFG
jgi:hypothetical protein